MAMSKEYFRNFPGLNLDVKGNVTITQNINYGRFGNEHEHNEKSHQHCLLSIEKNEVTEHDEKNVLNERKLKMQKKYDAHLNDDAIYQIRHHPRGRVLIINNGSENKKRFKFGSNVDAQSLDALWTKFDCKVIKSQHLTSLQIKEEIAEFAKMQKPVDFCAVFVMTHGTVRDMVVGEDGTTVNVKELVDMFKPDNCPHLKGMPKLMFFQMCRGPDKRTREKRVPTQRLDDFDAGGENDDFDGPMDIDWLRNLLRKTLPGGRILGENGQEEFNAADDDDRESGNISDKPDMLLGFATLEGEVAVRHTERGSWFIQAIVDIFSRFAHVDDIVTMMENVQEQVVRKRTIEGVTTTSITATTLKKKLFFYPGCKISKVTKSGTQ